MYPPDLKYTREHEWVRVSGDTADVGVTDYAQQQLGDVVYIELPKPGQQVRAGAVFGTIESVKAVSDLFAPVTGEVTAVNEDLVSRPEAVNSAPHDTWMIRIRLTSPEEVGALLDHAGYASLVAS
ncbi:MAG: glycine cleavage system protein GcvH [Acidimicrobiia bacterium]|nr:glycine cleavage system protein GcvH [Acidimicrobiia bacterium]